MDTRPANKPNTNKIKTFQNLALYKVLNTTSYVYNHTNHLNLKMS